MNNPHEQMNERDRNRMATIALHIYMSGDANDLFEEGWLGDTPEAVEEQQALRALYEQRRTVIDNFAEYLNDNLIEVVGTMIPDHLIDPTE